MKIRASTSAPSRLRWRTHIFLLTATLALQAVAAQQAGSQRGLLDFDSGRALTALAVEQAIREGDPWEQLSWTFTLRPSVLYRRYLDERGGELLNPRLSATLQLRFGEKPLDTIRRAVKLERALNSHDRAGRLEVRDALLAHAELLLAQDAARTADLALDALTEDAPPLERQAAELAARTEKADLAAARNLAASFGFHGVAVLEPLRFSLPVAPDFAGHSAVRLQQLAVAEAEARYVAAGAAGLLRDFRLGAGIRGEGLDFDLEAGLMAGRPGVRIATIHPGGRARMEIRVSAEIAIGDSLRELPYLAAEVERTQAELEQLVVQLRADWLVAMEAASLAGAELDLSEAELGEASTTRAELLAAHEALPETTTEEEAGRLLPGIERAGREVQRLQTRVYRAWITYVRRHYDLLEASQGSWAWQ